MLTTSLGPDVEPYHLRQVVVLRPEDWGAWVYLPKPETELLRPLREGSLNVQTVRKVATKRAQLVCKTVRPSPATGLHLLHRGAECLAKMAAKRLNAHGEPLVRRGALRR